MASKFDQFLKASWNAIFSIQDVSRCQEAEVPRYVAVGGVLRGEDLGGGQHKVSVVEATKSWIGDPARRTRLGGGLKRPNGLVPPTSGTRTPGLRPPGTTPSPGTLRGDNRGAAHPITWTFSRHQRVSYRTYRVVIHTDR